VLCDIVRRGVCAFFCLTLAARAGEMKGESRVEFSTADRGKIASLLKQVERTTGPGGGDWKGELRKCAACGYKAGLDALKYRAKRNLLVGLIKRELDKACARGAACGGGGRCEGFWSERRAHTPTPLARSKQ